jgi:hypothetical protein
MRGERDLPEGHPSASDYDPNSKAAKRYAQRMQDTASNRDWPKGHPGAADNPNRVEPSHPLETSRDHTRPETVAAPQEQPRDPLADEDEE